MTQTDILQTILKDSNYHLVLFDDTEIHALRERIFTDTVKGKQTPFIHCPVRNKPVQLKPEELIRQLYAARLRKRYGYPKTRIAFEYAVSFGRERKRADIVIVDKDRLDTPYIIVEVKKPKHLEGKAQLRSYCNATGAPIGIWTNGQQISHYHRKEPNYFEEITDIPNTDQTLADILNERFTLKDLILKDKLATERKSLKDIILELEDEVLANAGVNVFEEVFKLIFTKLYDEFKSKDDKAFINRLLQRQTNTVIQEAVDSYPSNSSDYETRKKVVGEMSDDDFRVMEFRNTGQTDAELRGKIQRLFDDARNQWQGVFPEISTFKLSARNLSVCVSSLQNVKLFNANLQVVDEAFEYLVGKSGNSETGHYFTPRHVIDMCVKMLNPTRGEFVIDTAAGICRFPIHTVFKITGTPFTTADIPTEDKEDVHKVFGIDFSEKAMRIARILNLIAGDGEPNVLRLNTLDYEHWNDSTKRNRTWMMNYSRGFDRLKALRVQKDQNRLFNFDVLMAHPPFGWTIKDSRILNQYKLGCKRNGEAQQTGVRREVLFIERNLDFLKPGGRMAVVLPQGILHNPSDRYVRDFIAEHARILAIVGLHPDTFKSHTGAKTSVLFLQKWNDDAAKGPLCPKVDDYPTFFAVSTQSGKDNAGDSVYLENGNGEYQLDKNGCFIVKHDLHNHDSQLPDGIAEAFIEWAKSQRLSFWS